MLGTTIVYFLYIKKHSAFFQKLKIILHTFNLQMYMFKHKAFKILYGWAADISVPDFSQWSVSKANRMGVLLSHRVLSSLGSVKEEGASNQEKAVLT